jgi:4-diphosphocytidyl-2-C-methyl-D-erythritol kinase
MTSEEAEQRLAAWLQDAATPGLNSMEPPAFAKFIALPALIQHLERTFGLEPRMSGSGSACFTFLPDDTDSAPIIAAIHEAWGQSAFVCDTRLA